MDVYSNKAVIFLIAVLYRLPEGLRGIGQSESFDTILKRSCRPNLHEVLNTLHNEGLLGEFGREFEFDPLYGVSNVDRCLMSAQRDMLMRVDGTTFSYHLDVLETAEIGHMLARSGIPADLVSRASERLNELMGVRE